MTVKKRLIDELDMAQPKAKIWKSEMALARMSLAEGKLNDASRLLHKSLEISKELNEHDFATGVCELGLAILAEQRKDSKEAHHHFDKAINFGRRESEEKYAALLGVALRHHANLFWDEGDTRRAKEMLEESQRVLQEHASQGDYHLALTICDLAAVSIAEGDQEKASGLLPTVVEYLGSVVETPDDVDYRRAIFLFDLAISKPEEDEFFQLWKDNATKMQYQTGAKHPYLIRVLTRFARTAKKAGRQDLTENLAGVFSNFPKA